MHVLLSLGLVATSSAAITLQPYALSFLPTAIGSPCTFHWKLRGTAVAQHSYSLRVYHALSNATLFSVEEVSPYPRASLPPFAGGGPRTGLIVSLSLRAAAGGAWSARAEAPFALGPGPALRDWGGAQ